MTPVGMVAVPLSHGKPLPDEEFQLLPTTLQQELEQHSKEIQERIASTLRQVRQMMKEGPSGCVSSITMWPSSPSVPTSTS